MDDDCLHGLGSGGKELQYGGRHGSVLLESVCRWRRLRFCLSDWYLVGDIREWETFDDGRGRRRFILVWPVSDDTKEYVFIFNHRSRTH